MEQAVLLAEFRASAVGLSGGIRQVWFVVRDDSQSVSCDFQTESFRACCGPDAANGQYIDLGSKDEDPFKMFIACALTIGMNLILEKSEQIPWFTDMAATFLAMGVDPRAYDWYVSDVETNASIPVLNEGDGWVTGDELASALLGEPIQFIWAVFSAFPPGVRFEVGRRPSADGNPSFWRPPDICPQLPGACFEVVCWDSSATLLIGVSQEQADRYLRTYSDVQPLSSTWSSEG